MVAFASVAQAGGGRSNLRDYAQKRNFLIGTCVDMRAFYKDAAYTAILAREFNALVAENAFKQKAVWTGPHTYNFKDTDALVDFAQKHKMKIRGHCLVWHHEVPQWLKEGHYSGKEVNDLLKDYITAFVSRYKGKVDQWDVVNEAIDDKTFGLRLDSFWFQKLGPEYLSLAFQWAHKADPKAKLYYNEYSAEDMGKKSETVYGLLADLMKNKIPVSGVGWQCHILEQGWRTSEDMTKNAKRLGKLGLEIMVTELDVSIKLPTTKEKLLEQAQCYRDMMDFCLKTPQVKGLLMWGFTDAHSWIPSFQPGKGDALIFDKDYQPKPAYQAMLEELAKGKNKK